MRHGCEQAGYSLGVAAGDGVAAVGFGCEAGGVYRVGGALGVDYACGGRVGDGGSRSDFNGDDAVFRVAAAGYVRHGESGCALDRLGRHCEDAGAARVGDRHQLCGVYALGVAASDGVVAVSGIAGDIYCAGAVGAQLESGGGSSVGDAGRRADGECDGAGDGLL